LHGGISPQEIVIPVVEARRPRAAAAGSVVGITWELRPGSEKITTRFCSLQVTAVATGLFPLAAPPRVRVELRAGAETLSTPVSASYGFEEAAGDVQLRLTDDETPGMHQT